MEEKEKAELEAKQNSEKEAAEKLAALKLAAEKLAVEKLAEEKAKAAEKKSGFSFTFNVIDNGKIIETKEVYVQGKNEANAGAAARAQLEKVNEGFLVQYTGYFINHNIKK